MDRDKHAGNTFDLFGEEEDALLLQLLDEEGFGLEEVIPRRKPTDTVPLSFAQQRVWFLDQFEPGSPNYNIAEALRLEGPLNRQALQSSLTKLLQRHESLRTTVALQENQPVQVIAERGELSLRLIDLSGLSATQQQATVQKLINQEAHNPFDLSRGPLFRAALLLLEPTTHILLLNMHHIISDARSLEIFIEELTYLYHAYCRGQRPELPELPLQYADYAIWQRQTIQKETLEKQLHYWCTQLKDVPPLELPTDYPRPPLQTQAGAWQDLTLSASLLKKLQALSEREGMTLFMTLLAAFQMLLAHYSNQTDIAVGIPVTNRTRVELENIIGFFVNTLVIRSKLTPEQTLQQVLRQVRNTLLDAYEHQDVPFEKVVDALDLERDPSRSPLIQVMFIYHNTIKGAERLGDLAVTSLKQEHVSAKFDLALAVEERLDGLHCLLEYNTDLFKAETIRSFLQHWQTLLEHIAADPTQHVHSLTVLPEEERQRLLFEWNDTDTENAPRKTFPALFIEQAEQRPDQIALTYHEHQLTYDELHRRSNQLAHYLRAKGVGPDVLVGICTERSVESFIALFGVLKAGGAYVPLDPAYPPERLAFMLQDANIHLLLTQSHISMKSASVERLCLDTEWSRVARMPTTTPDVPMHLDHIAYMIYTSGSTGTPKGVQVTHRGIGNLAYSYSTLFSVNEQSRILQFASLSFDASVVDIMALLLGATIYADTQERLLPGPDLTHILREQAISLITVPPSVLAALPPAHLPALETIIAVGEACPPALVAAWSPPHHFFNGYGPTETTVGASTIECFPDQPVTIGKPIPNFQVYLLNQYLQPVPVGVPGEIYIGGVGLARGYLNRPDLTAERFLPHPFSKEPGARLYRTGDLGRHLPDGSIEFVGRVDQQVKLRGYRIEPGEVEATLRRHPAISEAVVMIREDTHGHKQLVAYVIAATALTDTPASFEAQVQDFLRQSLPHYMVPSRIIRVDSFPLNANGKLDRRALPAPSLSATSTNEAPRSPLEAQLHSIWQAVLQLDTFGIHDNFFSLGGDSILSIQVVSRAAQAGLSLSPRHLFQHQTIAQLAAFLHTQPDTATPITPAQAETLPQELPLLPIMQWFLDQQPANPHHFNQSILLQLQTELSSQHISLALTQLVQRHDAFQLFLSGNLLRRREPSTEASLQQVALDALSPDEQQTTIEQVAEQAHASLSLEHGPLLRAVLFTRGQQPSLLLLVIHHLAVDGVSWRVILSELQTILHALLAGKQPQLPPPGPSFWQWGHALLRYVHTHADALRQQLPFWLAQHPPTAPAFPLDQPQGQNLKAQSQVITVTLSAEETRALLQQVPHAYQTRVQDVLLSALLLAFSEWTEHPSLLLHLEGHGRVDLLPDIDLSQTVGWFTALYPLLLQLPAHRDPASVLKSVKEQLRRLPEQGIGYGLLRYLHPDEQVRRSFDLLTEPQLIFNYLGQFDGEGVSLFTFAPQAPGAEHSPENRRSHLISIDGMVANGCLSLQWEYSSSLHAPTTIQQLATSFLSHLHSLIQHCLLPQAHGFTPSDFPLASLSQAQLDSLALPPSVEDLYPLSPLQAGMLFHAHEASGSDLYIQLAEFRLQGALDPQRLRDAFATVQQRHHILRTSFLWHELEHPLQVVFRRAPFPWLFADWRSLPPDVQQLRLEKLRQEERTRGFDLTNAPLFRVHLIQLAERQWVLLWCFHHILLDGWSLPLLFQEALHFYEHAHLLTLETARPYRDYIAWLQQQDQHQALSYWRRLLAGFSTPTRLPIQHPAPLAQQQQQYAVLHLSCDQEHTASLLACAKREQLTMNTLLQAAWALLLSRYSGSNDVLFGTTVAGRPASLAGIEHTAGLFINTLPVRVQLPVHQPLSDWLRELQAQQAEARLYEYAPLFEIQRCSEVPAGQRLFDTLLVFENYPLDEAILHLLPDLEIQDLHIVEKANYPLVIQAMVQQERLELRLTYDTACFDASPLQRLLNHLLHILLSLAHNTSNTPEQLSLIPYDELDTLLTCWNQTRTPYPATRTLPLLFAEQVQRTPDAIALLFEDEQLTYAELDTRSNHLASYLRRAGVGLDTPVGLWLERTPELLIAILGILKAGGAYVPLDTSYPAERLAFLFADARLHILLTRENLLQSLPTFTGRTICLDRDWQAIGQTAQEALPPIHPDNLAYIMYTSGSTGQPKGVGVTHRNIIRLVRETQYARFSADEVFLHFAPISFDASTFEIWGALLNGGRLVIFPSFLPSMNDLKDALKRYRISTMWLTEGVFRQLVESSLEDLSSLQQLLTGGDVLSPPHVARALQQLPGCRLINGYGPTECTTFACCHTIERLSHHSVPIGTPIANAQAYILDRQLHPVPIGVPGELYIGGDGLARGYLNQPHLTAERFIPHPFSDQPGARLYKTGDLVRYLEDGTIDFLGRLDQQIKIRGFRVEPGEIEAVICQHPDVRECVVTVWEEQQEKRLLAIVVGKQLAREELRQYVADRLPAFMQPAYYSMVDTLPLTPNGKIDRRLLPQLVEASQHLQATTPQEPARQFVPPRDATEFQLMQIWEDLFQRSDLNITDNFFELGGHSIMAMRLVSLIQKQLGQAIPIVTLFQHPTIEELAMSLRHLSPPPQQQRLLVPIQPRGTKPPLFCVHPAAGTVFCYTRLARLLDPEQPFYGLQLPEWADENTYPPIERLASLYIDALREVQPTGPYRLSGWSFGGIVAFEMAQQLHQVGEEVALLAIIDSAAHLSDPEHALKPDTSDAALALNMIEAYHLTTPESFEHWQPEAQLDFVCREMVKMNMLSANADPAHARRFLMTTAMSKYAAQRYVPHVYPHRITLFRATETLQLMRRLSSPGKPPHITGGWERLTKNGVDVYVVPGDHEGIVVGPAVHTLAISLQYCLDSL
uniref:Non-ribosomal peptide synthetase n=1 Tax=Thermosporothrix sp. COM3 TaxID=2490863 RepID=A0A455SHV1_9CHLR|nr:non-ribosomal peptide synthetase [Thermosporothrix sp. COM3]